MHTVQESTVSTLSRAISIDHSRSAYMFITPVRASDRLRPTRYYNRLCRCRLLSFPPKQWSPFTLACNISRVVGHISLRTRRHDRWGAWGVAWLVHSLQNNRRMHLQNNAFTHHNVKSRVKCSLNSSCLQSNLETFTFSAFSVLLVYRGFQTPKLTRSRSICRRYTVWRWGSFWIDVRQPSRSPTGTGFLSAPGKLPGK